MSESINLKVGVVLDKATATTNAQKTVREIEATLNKNPITLKIDETSTTKSFKALADGSLALSSQVSKATDSMNKHYTVTEKLDTATGKLQVSSVKASAAMTGLGNSAEKSAQSMGSVIVKILQWTALTTAVFAPIHALQEAVTFINDMNKAMTNIQMITGDSAEQVAGMVKQYSNLASTLHETTSSMMAASEEFLRAGNNAKDTASLLQASTVMSKIAGQSQEDSATSMISIMNAFHMNADEMMSVVDKMVAIDNVSATSTAELSTAIQKTAASAQESGVSFSTLASWIGTVSSVTRQSASTIGQGLLKFEPIAA
jgi:hypothetical protein